MGYVDYFLIVWDFIKYAKDNDIVVGPGRGSAAGVFAILSTKAYGRSITLPTSRITPLAASVPKVTIWTTRTLTVIRDAVSLAGKSRGRAIDMNAIDYDDKSS